MQVLASQKKVQGARFWGKIMTQGQDYFVIEAKAPVNNRIDNIKGFEQEGVGVNSLQYWVTQNGSKLFYKF